MLRMLDHQHGPVISVSISSVSGVIATLTIEQIRLYSINGDLISYINLNQQQHHQHNHHFQQQQQQQQPHHTNTANVMNEPTVILVTPCLLGQDGVKLVTGHKGGYIYLWKLRKFTNNYDENVDNGEHNSSNSYNNNDNTNDDYNSSSGSSKNKIHSYKTIKNESQLLELFITSIPTRIHKASITVLKLCSTNYAIKSKEIISRSLEDRRYLDLLVGDNDGYVSRWSTLKLDQLTSFDLLSIISADT